MRTARAMVFVFGLVAYGLALGSDGVHTLVEEASAFGSAGVFTVALFASIPGASAIATAPTRRSRPAWAPGWSGIFGWICPTPI
ncbi:hypothetical protein [Methylogaea oryzae]|uniref:hypothetical protein n=1 Tax=Methylogaea oryzae TaxID=1295382 RepID=UPI00138F13B9|nr:hypothetical protein [Methylogaea oryzae]